MREEVADPRGEAVRAGRTRRGAAGEGPEQPDAGSIPRRDHREAKVSGREKRGDQMLGG